MDLVITSQDIDMSSSLPETIFSNIISWLPVREAVRTSVVVKRWKDAWRYLTRLDLDPVNMMRSSVVMVKKSNSEYDRDLIPSERSMEDLIRCTSLFTSIIQSIQTEVTHCRLVHVPTNMFSGELNEWVKLLVERRRVKSLILTCSFPVCDTGDSLVLSPGIFSDLKSLELTHYSLFDVSPLHGCKKLIVLKLSSLKLNDGSVSGILSCCESLEELSLLHCSGIKKLQFFSGNLKLLELQRLCIQEMNICAEALTTLILDSIFCKWSHVVIIAPSVAEFKAYRSIAGERVQTDGESSFKIYLNTEELLERFSGILTRHEGSSSHMGYVSPLNKLKVLSTTLDLNDIRHAILLSYIFRVCFHLEKLDITAKVGWANFDQCDYPEHLFWEKNEISDSISNCLRVVSVQEFRGKVLEMELLKYIITKAPRMRRIIVKCNSDCKVEDVTATLSLLSLPRASLDVSIVIETPENRSRAIGVIVPERETIPVTDSI